MISRALPLVLVVHEDPAFVHLIREAFIQHRFAVSVEQVADNKRLVARLDRVSCPAGGMVMVAAQMRSRGGLQAIRLTTHHRCHLPVMLLVLDANLTDETMALESGALAVMELPVDVDEFAFIVDRARSLLAVSLQVEEASETA